uniref:Uncharacterized protein n=1 Tax=Gallus gallus TaxID=9031 RepID=A0A8V0X1Q3_CHICK
GRSPRSERGPLPVRSARGSVTPPRLGTWAVIARGCCVSLFISFSEFLVVFIFLFIFGLALSNGYCHFLIFIIFQLVPELVE